MICALLLGRGGSQGLPGKNTHLVLGRPLMEYPLIAAKQSHYVDRTYVSTDSAEIAAIGRKYNVELIERPPELATSEALGEDAFYHGYTVIRDRLAKEDTELEFLVLLLQTRPL